MSFFEELWNSIFLPGTTPTLVLATNISFALLQLTLVLMLYATGSIHFVVMNLLCGGLWAGIRWFIKELEDIKKMEEADMKVEQDANCGDHKREQKKHM